MKNIANTPPKGTSDWLPIEYSVRKYIFDTWRRVCEQFGYEEYLTPTFENADIYRAKSGEDVGGKELMIFKDKAEREFALRPEMTPSVTRMVSSIYDSTPKPIRLFSIANFFRNEKPQKGRNREFWQLNFDVFGEESINADIEILKIAVEIMLAFGADESMFEAQINDRRLTEFMLNDYLNFPVENNNEIIRVIDKFNKVELEDFKRMLFAIDSNIDDSVLIKILNREEDQIAKLLEAARAKDFMADFLNIYEKLEEQGYASFIKITPGLARGLDYYDGMVFEVFDKNPENNRALFGGGRYNGLASIFGKDSFPSVGCAPGDETMKIFLESWNLLDNSKYKVERYYAPILDSSLQADLNQIVNKLRLEGKNIAIGLSEERFGKAISYADKAGFDFMIIFGTDEKEQGGYKIKDLRSGEERLVKNS